MEADNHLRNVTLEDFNKNRDYLMKIVEKDLRLIALICWALNILYKDKSFHEIVDYIAEVPIEDLEKNIKLESSLIEDRISTDTVFDIFYRIMEDGKTIGYLNIENQTHPYPLDEIEARSIYNLFTIVFREKGTVFTGNSYRDMVAPIALWIFPKPPKYRKNTVQIAIGEFPSKEIKYNFQNKKSGKPEEISPDFEIVLKSYRCFLGEPTDLDLSFNEVNEENKTEKIKILLLLLDVMFVFGLSQEERIELARKYFKLVGETTELEAKAMTELQNTIYNLFRDEFDELETKSKTYQEGMETYKKESETYKKENKTLKKELEERDRRIAELEKKIKS